MHRFFKRKRREIADNMDMVMEGYIKRETEFRSPEKIQDQDSVQRKKDREQRNLSVIWISHLQQIAK